MAALAELREEELPRAPSEQRRESEQSFWSTLAEGPVPLASLMNAILQRVQIGICVVDQQFNLVYANDAGRNEIRSSKSLSLQQGKLLADSEAARAKIRKAIEGAFAGRWALIDLGVNAHLPAVTAVPLGQAGFALLVFGTTPLSYELAISFFVQAHCMTVAEGNVLRGLAEGLSPKQIACQRGVAVSTIRTQIVRLRERTRTRTVRELMLAVSRLPPVMPVGLAAS